jgi:hypothetical protein
MKTTNEDWAEESKPLIKSPAHEEMDIIQSECGKCGKKVQHIAGVAQPHACDGDASRK